MPQIILLHKDQSLARYMLGQVPLWLNENDPRPAAQQINEHYRFGGWQRIVGPKLGKGNAMCYPGDPPQLPLAEIVFRKERIFAYASEFWAILQPDGSVEFARLD